MTLYVDNKKQTKALKSVLKPHTTNKLVGSSQPKEKKGSAQKEPFLPLRGR